MTKKNETKSGKTKVLCNFYDSYYDKIMSLIKELLSVGSYRPDTFSFYGFI